MEDAIFSIMNLFFYEQPGTCTTLPMDSIFGGMNPFFNEHPGNCSTESITSSLLTSTQLIVNTNPFLNEINNSADVSATLASSNNPLLYNLTAETQILKAVGVIPKWRQSGWRKDK